MGNSSSKESGSRPESANISPVNSARPDDESQHTKRPSRKDSHIVSSARTSAAAPVASLENATGQSSQARASHSSSRGRSQTAATSKESASDQNEYKSSQLTADTTQHAPSTPNRSRSPAPVQVPPNIPAMSDAANKDSTPSPRSASSPTPYYLPTSQYGRPPRLPLPIEEEILSPGSPIITPADVGSNSDEKDGEGDGSVRRRASVLSSTTVDEDDVGDDANAALDIGGPTVDTLIEWKEGGEKVYVTGNFAGFWTKKYRLRKDGPSKDSNVFSANIPLPPGTHHLTFLVDGASHTSKYMPTAVDYTNMLVNYVEIVLDDAPKPAQPQDIPQRSQSKHTPTDRRGTTSNQHLSSFAPPTPELKPAATAATTQSPAPPGNQVSTPSKKPAMVKRLPAKSYHTEIPAFLLDLDAPEESSRFRRANAVMGTQPVPPTLPMFLNKSILNGATPMKDDASVLIMPNHTVLNHLATSSIKDGVLATSATTRYKKKYVTTIMYKPTGDLSG